MESIYLAVWHKSSSANRRKKIFQWKNPGLLQQDRYNNDKLNTWLENVADLISFSNCLGFLLAGLEYFWGQIFLW